MREKWGIEFNAWTLLAGALLALTVEAWCLQQSLRDGWGFRLPIGHCFVECFLTNFLFVLILIAAGRWIPLLKEFAREEGKPDA